MTITGDMRLGTELLGYRIDELLGRGGMGVVYRAFDLRLKRNVALKLIAPELSGDEHFRERFLTETELAASLDHPNVIPIYSAGEHEGQLYLAMRYVEGRDLKALLREAGPLEAGRAVAIVGQVAAALDAAHERGLVHRDVKPSNVLLDTHEHVYLADFGLSRRLSEQAPGLEPTLSLGTPAYVAPEQIEGDEVDGRADVYSLGCLLYESLTGEAPYPRDSELAVLWAHLNDPPPSPPGLEEVMAKALAKRPEERYASSGELVKAAKDGLGIAAPARPLWSRAPAVMALGLALIAAALSAFFLSRGDGGPAKPSTKPTLTPTTDSLQRIDPKTNELVATIRLGTSPTAIAVGENAVWLVDSDGGTVSRIDPNTNSVSRTGAAGARPATIAAGQGVVWIVGGGSLFGGGGTLFRLDPETLAIIVNVAMLGDAWMVGGGIVIGERDLWVTNAAGIERRGPSGETIAVIDLPLVADAPAAGLVLSGGALWTLENDGLARISTRRNNVVARIPLPRDPAFGLTGIAGLAGGADAVWLTNAIRDTVIEVDARSNRVKRTIRVGHDPIGIAFAEGWLWVANHTDGTVSKIQPKTGKVVATIRVGPNPSEIAAGEGGVWVTVSPT